MNHRNQIVFSAGRLLPSVFLLCVACGSAYESGTPGVGGRPSGGASAGGHSEVGGQATEDGGQADGGGDAGAGGQAHGGDRSSMADSGAAGSDDVTSADGGSAGAEPEVDPRASHWSVSFPPPISYTDAALLTVRGAATDSDGVAAVKINETAAVSSDGFQTWQARVPVGPGSNAFRVSVQDTLGNVTTSKEAFVVENHGTSLVNVSAMDFDADGGSVIVSDFRQRAIVRIDAATGRASVLSGPDRGSGAAFNGSDALAVDAQNQRILSFSWADDVLLGIDWTTGDRRVISPSSTDPSLDLEFANGIALDAANQRAFVVNSALVSNIIAIDLATGERRVVTSADVGQGPAIGQFNDAVYDDVTVPSQPRLLVSDTQAKAILAVDIATGDRTVLSSNAEAGRAFEVPGRMKLDPMQHRVLVVDGMSSASGQSSYNVNRAALIAVDLPSGERTTLSDPFVGTGFLPETPFALAFDAAHGQAYLANVWGGEIAALDLTRATRRLLTDSDVGSGEQLLLPAGLAIEAPRPATAPSFLIADELLGSLLRVDALTGERVELSGQHRGSGPSFFFPEEVVLAPTSPTQAARAFVVDAGLNAVLSVDLATGDRVELSGPNVGAGPGMGNTDYFTLKGMALDATHNRLLVANEGIGNPPAAIYAVDLTSGDRTVISSASQGTGPALVQPNGIVVDASAESDHPSAFVLNNGGISRVDLNTGNRSTFSSLSPAVGLGDPLFSPQRGVFDAEQGTLLVCDYFGFLVGVRANGNRGLISGQAGTGSSTVGNGPSFDAPFAIQADFAHRVGYVADSTRVALFAVDLVSGDRVLISR